MNYNKIIDNAIENTKTEFDYLTIVEKSVARFAAIQALDLAGFSGENVPDSPRPVSNSPRRTGKNSEFGPTELR